MDPFPPFGHLIRKYMNGILGQSKGRKSPVATASNWAMTGIAPLMVRRASELAIPIRRFGAGFTPPQGIGPAHMTEMQGVPLRLSSTATSHLTIPTRVLTTFLDMLTVPTLASSTRSTENSELRN